MPLVYYDVPVTNDANIYTGAGSSFVEENGKPTPLGNKDAVVLTTGVEAQVTRDLLFYSDAYENNSGSAVSFQAGAAYRFR